MRVGRSYSSDLTDREWTRPASVTRPCWPACAIPAAHADAETIQKALVGHYRSEHLFALEQALGLYEAYQERAQACDVRIEDVLKALTPFRIGKPFSCRRASREAGSRTDQDSMCAVRYMVCLARI